jgi:hypothetical protein
MMENPRSGRIPISDDGIGAVAVLRRASLSLVALGQRMAFGIGRVDGERRSGRAARVAGTAKELGA